MFKRGILTILLVMLVSQVAMPIITFADDSGNFVIKNGVLTKYNGSDNNVIIPEGVTSIGNYAFQNCSNMTSIIMPDNLLTISEHAFCNYK